ncbi:hypothetical protein DEV91_101472 [Phyllobacterium brassicacearum]|nr:hypothetical protein DEV91_101472 [Phyllobacterium brassicacearum]
MATPRARFHHSHETRCHGNEARPCRSYAKHAAFQKRTDKTLYVLIVATAIILAYTVVRPMVN